MLVNKTGTTSKTIVFFDKEGYRNTIGFDSMHEYAW